MPTQGARLKHLAEHVKALNIKLQLTALKTTATVSAGFTSSSSRRYSVRNISGAPCCCWHSQGGSKNVATHADLERTWNKMGCRLKISKLKADATNGTPRIRLPENHRISICSWPTLLLEYADSLRLNMSKVRRLKVDRSGGLNMAHARPCLY